ncbi:MAG: hypothetical protein HDR04_03765 [Lachnospiraceae bacterium]|nr:hypothetical protein [Lachnospiraceae bacterium]
MSKKFYTEDVMASIKKQIKDENIPVREQYLASGYYERKMTEYRKQKEIVIFGSGNYGRDLYKMLKIEGIRSVKCFCDNGGARQGREFGGLDILSPQEAVERFPEAMYIITPRGWGDEILRQLVDIGINVLQISVFVLELAELTERL